jgi:hypothetical protein
MKALFFWVQKWLRRLRYREGRTLSEFIACDIRREVLVVSTARIDEGIIIARVRTTNVLYSHYGLVREPDFGPATETRLTELWQWSGKDWGGLGWLAGRHFAHGSQPGAIDTFLP